MLFMSWYVPDQASRKKVCERRDLYSRSTWSWRVTQWIGAVELLLYQPESKRMSRIACFDDTRLQDLTKEG